MNLRTRFLLYYLLLFVIAFLSSLFFEQHLLQQGSKQTKEAVEAQIIKANKSKQKRTETYISDALGEIEARIDAKLFLIKENPNLSEIFAPSAPNDTTWYNSAGLLLNNKWINFLQNKRNERVLASITSDPQSMQPVRAIPIDDRTAWIQFANDPSKPIYFGISLDWGNQQLAPFRESLVDRTSQVYALTFWSDLLYIIQHEKEITEYITGNKTDFAYLQMWGVSDPVDLLKQLFNNFKNALSYLEHELEGAPSKDRGEQTHWLQQQLHQRFAQLEFDPKSSDDFFIDNPKVENYVITNDQKVMIWLFTGLMKTFSKQVSPFIPLAPFGMAELKENNTGLAFTNNDIFHLKSLFDDVSYYANHACSSNVANSTAMIAPPGSNMVYVGNTLQLNTNGKTSYLTLGASINSILENLSDLLEEQLFLIAHNRIFPIGTNIDDKCHTIFSNDNIEEIKQKKRGFISIKGENYFYLYLTPFKDADFAIISLNEKEKELALSNQIEGSMESYVTKSFHRVQIFRIIVFCLALVLLTRLLRRSTTPILQLSECANKISQGLIDQIELPKESKRGKDEISELCRSFTKMVSKLKEKPLPEKTNFQAPLQGNKKQKKATILYAEICNLPEIAQTNAMKFELLKHCLSNITPEIKRFQGAHPENINNKIIAFFGISAEQINSQLQAIKCSQAIFAKLAEWNNIRHKAHLPPVLMRIGIHTDLFFIQNFDGENRIAYSSLSDRIEIAANLCHSANPMQILISETTSSAERIHTCIDALIIKEQRIIHIKGNQ